MKERVYKLRDGQTHRRTIRKHNVSSM